MKALQILLPPVYLLLCLVLMGLLDYRVPLFEFNNVITLTAGIFVMLAGLVQILLCARLFSRAATPIIPFEPSTQLITGGIYRYSRNPIYLGMFIMLCGAALILGSVSAVLVMPVFYLVILHGYISYEETFLTNIFGEQYRRYCGRVRRWL